MEMNSISLSIGGVGVEVIILISDRTNENLHRHPLAARRQTPSEGGSPPSGGFLNRRIFSSNRSEISIKCVRAYARYLCHLVNTEKTQYDILDVISCAGADYHTLISIAGDKYSAIGEMIDFCMDTILILTLNYCFTQRIIVRTGSGFCVTVER